MNEDKDLFELMFEFKSPRQRFMVMRGVCFGVLYIGLSALLVATALNKYDFRVLLEIAGIIYTMCYYNFEKRLFISSELAQKEEEQKNSDKLDGGDGLLLISSELAQKEEEQKNKTDGGEGAGGGESKGDQ